MASKQKIGLLGLLIITGFILTMSFASAATTIVTPAADSTVCLNANINVSTTDVHAGTLVNITIYAKSASTANSSFVAFKTNNSANMTAQGNSSGNIPVNFSVFEDSNDYILNVTVKNLSNGYVFGEDTNTGITIDCTVPQAPSALSPSDNTLKTDTTAQTFSVTVTGVNTTGCTLYTSLGGGTYNSYTMTHSGNTCTYDDSEFSGTNLNGNYYWYVRASDNTNTSDSGTNILQFQLAPTGGNQQVAEQNQQIINNENQPQQQSLVNLFTDTKIATIPLWVIILVAVIVIAIVYYNKKK